MISSSSRPGRRRAPSRFVRDVRAMAAVEFAVVLPVLLVFLLAGNELVRYVNACRAITNVANSLATQLASRSADNFGYNDAVFNFNSTMLTFPTLLKDAVRDNDSWSNEIAVTLSSISFTATTPGCTSNCTYKAKVLWSLFSPKATARSCATAPTAAEDSASPSLKTLPKDVFNAGSIIVADISYTYKTTFGSTFLPSSKIVRSVYLPPRYIPTVHYNTAGGPYQNCP